MKKTKSELTWRNVKKLDELRKDLYDSIDEFTEYIDSYRQQREAERWNDVLRNRINFIDELKLEMENISDKTQVDIMKIEYAMGYIRVKVGNKYKYKKCESTLV